LTRFLFQVSPCLTSLPNELLDHIFDSFSASYILPPINRRLLPFHQSQLFRSPILTESKYRRFKVALDSNEKLKDYVRAFELEFRPMASRKPIQVSPSRPELSEMLASLPNLESFTLRARPQIIDALLPSIEHFEKNPKLRSILAKPWVEESDPARDWCDAFDCSKLHVINNEAALGVLVGDTAQHVGPLIVEIACQKQQDISTFALRYCAYDYSSKRCDEVLQGLPFTRLEVTLPDLLRYLSGGLLSHLADPSTLKHLSLIGLNTASIFHDDTIPELSNFVNLHHLSISGDIFPSIPRFYETLRQLPLSSLEFGPRAKVDTQALIHLISSQSQPSRINLKLLVLNNLYCASADIEEDSELDEWAPALWTANCSKEGVEQLRIVAKGLGIDTAGTTFLGVDIEDSEHYQEALRRFEAEEESDEEVSDEEDEEEEYEREMLEREYEADMCSDHHEDEHEAECGCHRSWDTCWRYADLKGLRRRRY